MGSDMKGILKLTAITTVLVWTTGAAAQSYPIRPVTIIVPLAAGAATDIETRLYARKLSETMGQSFVTDYKPGAGTTLGANYVAKAAPDGYTLLALTGSFMASAALYPSLPFDPIKDLAPVALMSKDTGVIAAHPGLPYRSIPEYVAYAKANPDAINVATTGSGGGPHLSAAWFHGLTKTKVTFVHYKGAAAALPDLLTGRVHVMFVALQNIQGELKAGKLKAIGLSSGQRSALLPGVKTAAEQGVVGFDYANIFGISAPGAVPAPIIDRLAVELAKVAKSPDVLKILEGDGKLAIGSTPGQFRQLIASEIAVFKKIIQENGIKLEE